MRAPPPLGGPNSFNFMQFLGNFGKIVCWRPPGELAPPPRGNPGSTTGNRTKHFSRQVLLTSRAMIFGPGWWRWAIGSWILRHWGYNPMCAMATIVYLTPFPLWRHDVKHNVLYKHKLRNKWRKLRGFIALVVCVNFVKKKSLTSVSMCVAYLLYFLFHVVL